MFETAILSASLLMNVFLIIYSGMAARKLYVASVNLNTLEEVISKFGEHIEMLHESELFYGDQTLQAMIAHSKEVLVEIETYGDLMSLAYEEEPEIEKDA